MMMVTASSCLLFRPPPDPPPCKFLPLASPSPVTPPEPPDPPDAPAVVALLRCLNTSSSLFPLAITQNPDLDFPSLTSEFRSCGFSFLFSGVSSSVYGCILPVPSLQAFTQISTLKPPSRMAIKIGGGGGPPGSASDTSVGYECLSPVIYRSIFGSYLCQLENGSNSSCSSFLFIHSLINVQVHLRSLVSGYPYSFDWDAMLDVWVIRALVGVVLMDFVSFGYIFMSPGCLYSAIECFLPIASWFQFCLTSSRVDYLMLICRFSASCSCMALFSFRLEDCSTDNSLSVMFKGSTSWCHIASAIPSVVEIRGHLCNMNAAWDAKSRHCDIGVIFSGENTMPLPNLCESRNHVSSALMAEVIAVCFAVATAVYSNVRSLAVLSDSLSLIKLLKNGGSQLELFGIMFDFYHYLSYFDVISCIFIFLNCNGGADLVAISAFSLVVTIPLFGV